MEKKTAKLGDQSKCIEEALEVKAMEDEKMSEMILDEVGFCFNEGKSS